MVDILDLICPRCQAENIEGRPPTVAFDHSMPNIVGCDQCGFEGDVRLFIRDLQQEKTS